MAQETIGVIRGNKEDEELETVPAGLPVDDVAMGQGQWNCGE